MKRSDLEDLMNAATTINNALVRLNPKDHPNIPRRVWGRLWTDVRELQAKLMMLILLDNKDHPEKGFPSMETDHLTSAITELTQAMRDSTNRTIERNRCYSTQEAAAALRVSPRMVVRYVEAKALRYRQLLDHGYIFMGEDLLDYLDAMQKIHEKKVTKLRKVG